MIFDSCCRWIAVLECHISQHLKTRVESFSYFSSDSTYFKLQFTNIKDKKNFQKVHLFSRKKFTKKFFKLVAQRILTNFFALES